MKKLLLASILCISSSANAMSIAEFNEKYYSDSRSQHSEAEAYALGSIQSTFASSPECKQISPKFFKKFTANTEFIWEEGVKLYSKTDDFNPDTLHTKNAFLPMLIFVQVMCQNIFDASNQEN
jgi:hypothetical protein